MNSNISNDITIKELLDRNPQLLRWFLDMGLLCVGCPAESFHTLADVAREHGIDEDQLLHRLKNAMDNSVAINELKP